MEVSTKIRIIIILIFFTIIGLIILYFVHKNKKNTNAIPSIPQQISSNISKGGVFLTGPSSIQGQPLIYRDLNNKYYNAGYCIDCPSACSVAVPILDVIKTDCSSKTNCLPVLVSSAQNLTNSYIEQAGSNIMTQKDCSVVIDTSGDPSSTYANQQAMSLVAQSANGIWSNLWDYLSAHKDMILNMAEQMGEQLAISKLLPKIISEYAIVIVMLPGLLSSDANTRYVSGVNIGIYSGKDLIFSSLPKALNAFAESSEDAISEVSNTAMDAAISSATEIAAQATEEVAAKMVASVLESMAEEVIDPAFSIITILQLVGIVLDSIDPCGYGNTLDQDDINSTKTAFDSALFTSLLNNVGHVPVEWYAENIKEYGLTCQDKSIMKISRLSKDYLTRPENIFGAPADDCVNVETQLRLNYTKQYQDSLTYNSLGQCVLKLTNDEFNKKLSNIFGQQINLPSGKDLKSTGMFNEFRKTLYYVSNELANNNVVVANFINTYWYVVAILLVVILLISFFL